MTVTENGVAPCESTENPAPGEAPPGNANLPIGALVTVTENGIAPCENTESTENPALS